MKLFAVYSGLPKVRGHTCIARAKDPAHALRAARSNGIQLARTARAEALTVQDYADILRGCGHGLKVSGVPQQMRLELMEVEP